MSGDNNMTLLKNVKKFILDDPHIGYQIYRLKNPEKSQIVGRNKRFRNIHRNK